MCLSFSLFCSLYSISIEGHPSDYFTTTSKIFNYFISTNQIKDLLNYSVIQGIIDSAGILNQHYFLTSQFFFRNNILPVFKYAFFSFSLNPFFYLLYSGMKDMDYIKRILDVFSILLKFFRGFFFAFKESLPSHKSSLYNHLMFHLIKHFNQAKVKFHLDYYKSNRWFIIFQAILNNETIYIQ